MNQPRRARRAGGVKGRALLLFRLARQDIRHHFAQAVLLVVAIAAATTVVSLAFALNGVITSPYQQTMAATKGPDVVAQSADDPYTSVTSPADLAALVALNHAKGVEAHSGPYPIAGGTGPVGPVMRSTDIVTSVQVEGREPGAAAVTAQGDGRDVDRPGRGGRAVACRGGEPASRPDDHAERSLQVVGFAVTAAFHGFPGVGQYGPPSGGASLATKADPLSYISNLKLADASPRAVNVRERLRRQQRAPAEQEGGGPPTPTPSLTSWMETTYTDASFLRTDQAFLFTGTVLLGLLALAGVAVLVSGRLAEGTRRVGLLKATGGTPGRVAATFLAENLFLALVAAFVSLLVAGVRPRSLKPGPTLSVLRERRRSRSSRSSLPSPFRSPWRSSTLVPAIRAARMSAVSALAGLACRAAGFADTAVRKLPVAALFGLHIVAHAATARIFSAASIAVAVMGLVAALAIHAAVDKKFSHFGSSGGLVNRMSPERSRC
jgi:putative ABC transport system permease protein